MKPRPARLVFVAGTGTAVGKTWTAAAMLTRLRNAGLRVAARKPAQSFDVGDGPTDADVLARATGELPHTVCPPHRWYDRALAPPMAADAIGAPPFTVGDLVRELCWSEGVDVGLVEGAGGPRSPDQHLGQRLHDQFLLGHGQLVVQRKDDAARGEVLGDRQRPV